MRSKLQTFVAQNRAEPLAYPRPDHLQKLRILLEAMLTFEDAWFITYNQVNAPPHSQQLTVQLRGPRFEHERIDTPFSSVLRPVAKNSYWSLAARYALSVSTSWMVLEGTLNRPSRIKVYPGLFGSIESLEPLSPLNEYTLADILELL